MQRSVPIVAAAHAVTQLMLVLGAMALARNAEAAGTPAGTSIVNSATASYLDEHNTPQTATSNSVSILVEEVMDVFVSAPGAQPQSVTPGASEYMLSYRVTNAGNGPEEFHLLPVIAVGGDDFDPALISMAVDRDGDGIYNPLVDTAYAPGSEPALAPDASANVFVFVSLPASATDGAEGLVGLTARALTGHGTPGTLFAGKGVGSGGAVVGNSRAEATAYGSLLVNGSAPTLVKSQSFTGARPVRGSVVTYTIHAELGSGIVQPVVSDIIPAGVSYIPGSLKLGGAALSDAADGDAGTFTGSQVEVALVAAAGPQIVTFQVRVN